MRHTITGHCHVGQSFKVCCPAKSTDIGVTMTRLFLIMNPGSRSGRGRELWNFWTSGLEKAGVEYEYVTTGGPGDGLEAARGVTGFDTVVAVGGDGTINEVLDGLLQNPDRSLSIGVLYSGTSPDFCRFHGIPTEPEGALAALLSGTTRKVDCARIEYTDEQGSELSAHFGCSCNIGLGAAIARRSNRLRRWLGDAAGTAAAVLRTLTSSQRVNLELEIDGEEIVLTDTNNLSVLKNPLLASGLKLGVDLSPCDGHLALVAVCGRGIPGLVSILPGFYSGRAITARGVYCVERCRTVTVRSEHRVEIEFDGDPRGFLPVGITVLPGELNLAGGHLYE